MKFKITAGRGFHVTFANGCTLSVQFGGSNYCDNRNVGRLRAQRLPDEELAANGCANAEIAAWGPGKKFLRLPYSSPDGIVGCATPNGFAALVAFVAALDPSNLPVVEQPEDSQ